MDSISLAWDFQNSLIIAMNKYKYIGETNSPLTTVSGTIISDSFTRIVHGGRGDYVEVLRILKSVIFIPKEVNWRLYNPNVYYIEYRVKDFTNAKVYYQKRPVDYADYKVGLWYISPVFLKDFVKE